jgi:hypothetical protein
MPIEFFLSSMSLYPFTAASCMDVAKKSGYEGLELFRFKFLFRYPDLNTFRRLAQNKNLKLHFHEAWDSDDPNLMNKVPVLYGGLIGKNDTIEEQFGNTQELVVTNSHHWEEVARSGRKNFCLQTDSLLNKNWTRRTSFYTFMTAVKKHDIGVVFDTQHYLEWLLGKPGVSTLPRDGQRLMNALIEGFKQLRPLIREIHLANFNPSADKRNTLLDDGILNIKEFCQHVKQDGWQGSVVPEIHPFYFSKLSKKKNVLMAGRILEQTQKMFT